MIGKYCVFLSKALHEIKLFLDKFVFDGFEAFFSCIKLVTHCYVNFFNT